MEHVNKMRYWVRTGCIVLKEAISYVNLHYPKTLINLKDPMQNDFIELLRSLMQQRNLSQPKLAHVSDIPYETIRSWFRRGSSPREWESIVQIAVALQLDQTIATHLLAITGHPPLAKLQQIAISEINRAHAVDDEFRALHYQMLKEAVEEWLVIDDLDAHSGSTNRYAAQLMQSARVERGELPEKQHLFLGQTDDQAWLERGMQRH